MDPSWNKQLRGQESQRDERREKSSRRIIFKNIFFWWLQWVFNLKWVSAPCTPPLWFHPCMIHSSFLPLTCPRAWKERYNCSRFMAAACLYVVISKLNKQLLQELFLPISFFNLLCDAALKSCKPLCKMNASEVFPPL